MRRTARLESGRHHRGAAVAVGQQVGADLLRNRAGRQHRYEILDDRLDEGRAVVVAFTHCRRRGFGVAAARHE